MADTYVCGACHGTFEKGWTDEAALAEYDEHFGMPREEAAIICDDCYCRMMGLPFTESEGAE